MKPIESVPIELDKPRQMRLDMLALFRAEQKVNKLRGNLRPISIFNLIQREVIAIDGEEVGIPLDLMLALFWASLLHEDPGLTFEEAGSFAITPVAIMAKVVECLKSCVLGQAAEADDAEVVELPLPPPNGAPPSHSDG